MKTDAQVYVGTYAKYNDGDLSGDWISLDDMDADTFAKTCRELHKDENDPEIMLQDFDGFPKAFYTEIALDAQIWEYLKLDESDREVIDIFADYEGSLPDDLQDIIDAYQGAFCTLAEWAEDYMDGTGSLHDIPENLRYYFDFDKFARDCVMGGDIRAIEVNGMVHVFNNNI